MGIKFSKEEEIVEMGEGNGGVYHPVAVVKVNEKRIAHNDAMREIRLPRWIPITNELLGGFVIGLGAIENFVVNMRRLNRRVKK